MLDRSAAPEGAAPRPQPVFNVPGAVLATLLVLLAIHAVRLAIPDAWDDLLFQKLAFVPGRLTYLVAPDRVVDSVVQLAGQGPEAYRMAQVERILIGDGSPQPWTLLSYGLLHADWAHIGLNAIWLLAFGTPVARRLGAGRFFAVLAVTTLAGALAQWGAHPFDIAPVIGASAAVSGCMGATLRFMFQPHVPMAAIIDAAGEGRRQAFLQPARSLRGLLSDRRATTFIVAWFVTNLVFGLGSGSLGLASGPIAWEAHIGGFMAGLLLFGFFDPVTAGGEVEVDPPAGPGPAAEA